MICCVTSLLVGLLLAYILLRIGRGEIKPMKLPYSMPGIFFILKAVIFYGMVYFRKRKRTPSAGYGAASYQNISSMEKPQQLDQSMKAIEAVFFSGANQQGWGVVLAMQRRPKRVSTILAYVKAPNNQVLVPLSHPDCFSFRDLNDDMTFKAGGLAITPVTPMKEWHIEFNGILRDSTCSSSVHQDVKVNLSFKSNSPHFDYDTDMDQWTLSKAFATEPWSKQFFENLKSHHQTHYEQMGELSGTIEIDAVSSNVQMAAFRDHSYGSRRDWTLMHRYAFHHIFLDDGCKGVVGVVCQPSTCTRLVCGHWWTKDGAEHPVTDVDFYLHQHAENGTPPSNYAFNFTADGITHTVDVSKDVSNVHYLGWGWEAKLHETFVKYDVDGVKGVGITEWHYNNKSGRPSSVTELDPDWTKPLRDEYLTT